MPVISPDEFRMAVRLESDAPRRIPLDDLPPVQRVARLLELSIPYALAPTLHRMGFLYMLAVPRIKGVPADRHQNEPSADYQLEVFVPPAVHELVDRDQVAAALRAILDSVPAKYGAILGDTQPSYSIRFGLGRRRQRLPVR